ncbi:MAG: hypothetical protein M3R08_09980 [Bacteroidota bacterium]|nr:hypothetical protein [Bacteroidota bacterium]
MHVKVYGIWRFNGGGAKIAMPCGSSVLIGFGGQVVATGSGSSQTVKICSTTYWSASDGTVNGPVGWPETILPVELISFTGHAERRKIDLDWVTATEHNLSHFQIRSSRDGGTWNEVITVNAAGESSNSQHYTVQLEVAVTDKWYFKLLQFDLDGTAYQKGILLLNVQDEVHLELICGPLPVIDGTLHAHWKGEKPASAILVDARGTLSSPDVISSDAGMLQLDISKAPSGMHVLSVWDVAGDRRNCKLVIE